MNDPAYPHNGEAILSETLEDDKSVRVLLPLFYEKISGVKDRHLGPKILKHDRQRNKKELDGISSTLELLLNECRPADILLRLAS